MFFSFGPEIAYQVLTTSGVVNDSGKPQALYGVAFQSAGTSTVPAFFDGTGITTALGKLVFAQTGIANGWVNYQFATGLVFPKGLYVSFDAATSQVTTWSRQILT